MARAQTSETGGRRTERRGELELVVPVPTTRYLDQFLRLRCAEELLANNVFPNAKELTESFAAAEAVLHRAGLDPQDPGVTVVVVGDGSTPRTAATIALRSSWRVVSVDPALRVEKVETWPMPISGLDVESVVVEMLDARLQGPCVAVAVHAHVALADAIRHLERCDGEVVAAVAIPCCGWQHEAHGLSLVADYQDWGIWSPERRVMVWSR